MDEVTLARRFLVMDWDVRDSPTTFYAHERAWPCIQVLETQARNIAIH
jgi:hypothetical protein